MNPQDIRNMLMDATIKIVSFEGFENLTTRNIAKVCSLHDVYIYRYFIDKDDLLKKTFSRENEKILSIVSELVDPLSIDTTVPLKEYLRTIIKPLWDYCIANPCSCKFYIRYYYSQHYEKDIRENKHESNHILEHQLKKITSNNSTLLPQYTFITLLHFAIKNTSDEFNDSEKLFEEVLTLICCGITIDNN